MIRRIFIYACLAGLSLASRAGAADATPGPANVAELQARMDAFIRQPRFHGAVWGIKVISLDTGRVLFEHEAERRMSPASNCKLYDGALALDQLGAHYRIRTPVLATAAVDANGTLPGDLVIAGRGDPSWNHRVEKKDFWEIFAPFVAVLKQAGVRHITGDIVADATWLRGPPQGASWTADDANDSDGAEISAVSLADNYVDLRITPAAVVGQPCGIEMLQPLSGLTLDNRTVTAPAGAERIMRVQRLTDENTVLVSGQLPLGGAEKLSDAIVPRPAAWFASALREALCRAGIAVDGGARGVHWPQLPVSTKVKLGEVASPEVGALVAGFMKPSQNLETDLIFHHLGELHRQSATPAWIQSDELAVTALGKFLGDHQLRPGEVIFNEGSGLSRNNLATAAAVVDLLAFMAAHRERDAFTSSLPVAGHDGTLKKRMLGTPAEGNVRAKTGTLRWVNALSGYVTTAAGERLAFSFIQNRHQVPPGHKPGADVDELAVMLSSSRSRS